MDTNIKINVKYFYEDTRNELTISGFGSILPLSEISKKDMGYQLALDIARSNAGHEKVTIMNYNVEDL